MYERNQEHPMEFAFFSQEKLMLSTAAYDDELLNVLIGEAIRLRAMNFPRNLLEGDEGDSKVLYQITQSKYTRTLLKFEKLTTPAGQAVGRFREMTSGQSNLRGVMIQAYNKGIYTFSPNEPNPDKDPLMRGLNPKLELIGRFIQSSKTFKDDIFDDESSLLEVHPKMWETKEENSERLIEFMSAG